MKKKTEIARDAFLAGDLKKALRIVKDFKIGITQEQSNQMKLAYECLLYADFYKSIGKTPETEVTNGTETVKGVLKIV